MSKLFCFLALCFALGKTDAQIDTTKVQNSIKCIGCGIIDPTKKPLWLINGEKMDYNYIETLNPAYIEDLKILDRNPYRAKYGDLITYGVINVTLKKKVKIIELKKILNFNHVSREDRKLPIYIKGNVEIKVNSVLGINVKNFEIKIVEADSTGSKRAPFSGKYLLLVETKQ